MLLASGPNLSLKSSFKKAFDAQIYPREVKFI